jgi:lysophospholipase L1-like esterase
LVLLLAGALAVTGCLAAAAAAKTPRLYVALGDSYTAGPLIPNPTGVPVDCGRSTHNYPHLVAAAIKPRKFVDVSCGSATTKDMTHPQTGLPLGGTNPPQFNALNRKVDLVTVGIGGNDMGFGDIVQTCGELGFESGGAGHPCTDRYTAGGHNQIYKRLHDVVGPRLKKTFRGIHRRSPKARLVVVGFPDPVPQAPGCYPEVPIAPGDLPFLHGIARRLDRVERRRARQGDADFVDLLPGSIGHDVCQPPGTKWYEGAVPTSPAYPAHPNALGMEFAARQVLAVLGRTG